MLSFGSDPSVDLWPCLGMGLLLGVLLVGLWQVLTRTASFLWATGRTALRGGARRTPVVPRIILPPLAEVSPTAVLYIRTPRDAPNGSIMVYAAAGERINGDPSVTLAPTEECLILRPALMPDQEDDPEALPTWIASFVHRAPEIDLDA